MGKIITDRDLYIRVNRELHMERLISNITTLGTETWKNGKEFDENRYLKAVERALEISEEYHYPYLSVIPDMVAKGLKSNAEKYYNLARSQKTLF